MNARGLVDHLRRVMVFARPGKDKLWIKRCGSQEREAQPFERFVIAE